jgi:heme/copper-type cytochrome/quinol oxidase subunit 1
LLSAGTLLAGWGAFAPAAGALALSLVAVTAYAIDAGLSGSLGPRIDQPLGFLLIMLWSFGLLGAAALRLYADVTLHDTYAELAVGHLLGPMLASVALLAGAAGAIPEPLSRGPTAWFPWIGVTLCTVLTGVALWRITSGFVALGLAGMPRRYFTYLADTNAAWVDLGIGAALFGLGLVATTLVVQALALWRARARGRVKAAEREAEKAAEAARQRSARLRR